ncbi:uncharacterized protein B0I36DRAFT_318938 [Microdochium trichocladiopsis]|uniref:Transglutaminase-like domain-containing protein n=1 Tax=Microdochium trichocladiopsis TaxID=1682393 RepID=A0A9P8YCU9_9PEZI|nr:uncharacterized protein B0I36DRAFT_318938 [Microdochium trichocladiopsis]KAH7035709.1 hypothetical protein B0I36DRAFT_318938 [Microdochium trichocladiopsis]
MADVEEPKFNTLAERIAALNQQKNFTAPPPVTKRPPPPPPPAAKTNGSSAAVTATTPKPSPVVPSRPQKREPPALPQRTNTSSSVASVTSTSSTKNGTAPPALPVRSNTLQPSPALPPRRPSGQLSNGDRRGSNASDVSHISTVSTYSLGRASTHASTVSNDAPQPRRGLPPTLDQAKLPPLPPSRKEREAEAARIAAENFEKDPPARPNGSLVSIKSAPILPASRPGLPPRLPSRPAKSPTPAQDNVQDAGGPRRLPPPATSFVRPKTTFESSRPLMARPNAMPASDAPPPPVPTSSRPTTQQVEAVAAKAAAMKAATCLVCRDFSRPDAVAAQFPSDSLPRQDPIGYLANVLCGSFPSQTDKARAIFTWCHHNIAYDVEGFFGGCIQRGTPEETIFRGKGVCSGYADVYKAIADRAGLQCLVVGGHGKGYGHTPLKDGEQPPAEMDSNHAWNAVVIDNNEWKLLDSCWGAGNVGNQQYTKAFKPEEFTRTNEQFGLKHFPQDSAHHFRSDGTVPTWREYMLGPLGAEPVSWYGIGTGEGISEYTLEPKRKHISVYSGETVRFQVSKVCEHYDFARNGKGKPLLMLIDIQGVDGRKEDYVPFQTDGFWWWVDIPARDLGAPGQKVGLRALSEVEGKDARGVTKEEYFSRIHHKKMTKWIYYCQWELV